MDRTSRDMVLSALEQSLHIQKVSCNADCSVLSFVPGVQLKREGRDGTAGVVDARVRRASTVQAHTVQELVTILQNDFQKSYVTRLRKVMQEGLKLLILICRNCSAIQKDLSGGLHVYMVHSKSPHLDVAEFVAEVVRENNYVCSTWPVRAVKQITRLLMETHNAQWARALRYLSMCNGISNERNAAAIVAALTEHSIHEHFGAPPDLRGSEAKSETAAEVEWHTEIVLLLAVLVDGANTSCLNFVHSLVDLEQCITQICINDQQESDFSEDEDYESSESIESESTVEGIMIDLNDSWEAFDNSDGSNGTDNSENDFSHTLTPKGRTGSALDRTPQSGDWWQRLPPKLLQEARRFLPEGLTFR